MCWPARCGRQRALCDWTDAIPWQLPRRALQRLRGEFFLAPQVPPLPPRQRVVTAVLAGRLPRIGLWHSAALAVLSRPASRGRRRARTLRSRRQAVRAGRSPVRRPAPAGGPRARAAGTSAAAGCRRAAVRARPVARRPGLRLPDSGAAGDARRTLVATLHEVDMALRTLSAHRGPARRRAGVRPAVGEVTARAAARAVRAKSWTQLQRHRGRTMNRRPACRCRCRCTAAR